MGDSKENALFLPSVEIKEKIISRKIKVPKCVAAVGTGFVLVLLAWSIWATVTIQENSTDQFLSKNEITLQNVKELMEKNTSVATTEDDRNRRMDIADKINFGLMAAHAVCELMVWARRYPLIDPKNADYLRRTELANKQVEQLNKDIDLLHQQFEFEKKELDLVYEVYSYSTINVKNLVEAAEDLSKTHKNFEKLVEDNPTSKLFVDIKSLKVNPSQSPNKSTFEKIVNYLTWADYTANGVEFLLSIVSCDLSDIAGWIGVNVDTLELVDEVMDAISIGIKTFKVGKCIKDHVNLHGKNKLSLEKALDMKIKAQEGKTNIQNLLQETKEVRKTMYKETARLVTYLNSFMAGFNITCTTTVGTIHKDVAEINDYWQVIRKHGKLTYDAATKMINYEKWKDMVTQEVQVMMSKGVLTETLSLHSTVDPDNVVNALTKTGFSFPQERWSAWTKTVLDSNCKCDDDRKNFCWASWTRTCTSFDESTGQPGCVGPATTEVNICKIDPSSITFLRTCQDRDETYVGQCRNTQGQTLLNGTMGQQVNTNVNHRSCYKDCKKVSGATGCQFNSKNCLRTSVCFGDCFAFTQPLHVGDTMETLRKTCHIFRADQGTANSVLEEVIASTKKMFTDRNFDSSTLAAWKLSMSSIDPDLLESQQNGWKSMIKYQESSTDVWGGNPSNYSERTLTELRMVIDQTPTTLEVYEPCNFASNFAYYTLMSQTKVLDSIPTRSQKALGQAAAGLTLGSSFFHASHTRLGQELDNLMIKIIAYCLYETYINSLNLPEDTSSIIMHLKDGNRGKNSVELAQFMTDMFRSYPSDTWHQHIQTLDVPKYETTFGAIVITICTNSMGFISSTICQLEKGFLLDSLPIALEEKEFLIESFEPELSRVLPRRDHHGIEEAEFADKVTTMFKLLAAFVFQEDVEELKIAKPFLQLFGVQNFNDFLSSYATLQPSASGIPGLDWSYPGEAGCTSDHAVWHTQSARGLLDLFKLVDELVKRQGYKHAMTP